MKKECSHAGSETRASLIPEVLYMYKHRFQTKEAPLTYYNKNTTRADSENETKKGVVFSPRKV